MPERQVIYASYLTIRLPHHLYKDEAREAAAIEVIRPLARVIREDTGGTPIKLGAEGVYATQPHKHLHLIVYCNRPIPTIDGKDDPTAALKWRQRLKDLQRKTSDVLRPGPEEIHITDERDPVATYRYTTEKHLVFPSSGVVEIAKRNWDSLYRIYLDQLSDVAA